MGKIGFLMAGQGSQYVGMGKDFYENYGNIRDYYAVADEIRERLIEQSFFGDADELNMTINTQPCLFMADLAAALALMNKGLKPDAVAGFSLGEIPALVLSGIMDFKSGMELVIRRATLMQEAVADNPGSMVAVITNEREVLSELCNEYGVYPVNYNSPMQVVVAGENEKIAEFGRALIMKKLRVIPLKVSGAFHTPFMQPAKDGLLRSLVAMKKHGKIRAADFPIYSNLSAQKFSDEIDSIIEYIALQVCNPVRWDELLINMSNDGIDTFIECGPGKVLSGLVKKTLPSARAYSVFDMDSLKYAITKINQV